MRRIIIGIICIVFVICLINNNDSKEIRVRVIPNSDSKTDLAIKEDVKEFTICYLKKAYDKDYETYLKNINDTINNFQNIIIEQMNQKIDVSLSNHTLYNKTYNNNAVKNTCEMTLYVIIGEGKGANWWGTVYPEFLEIESSEEFKYESLIISIFEKIKGENHD